ncbi:MAG: hypothetical protein VXV91_08745, partial [Verrucomicrobiota bacterium]|nr:hypothetical protein [Verrucomicrobiota bacterium]
VGRCLLELAQGLSRVALAWHKAGGSTPFGVTEQSWPALQRVALSFSLAGWPTVRPSPGAMVARCSRRVPHGPFNRR